MRETRNSRGMIGKDNTTIQAVISKEDRKAIKQIAKSQDRSESYIVAQIIREHLESLSVGAKK